MENIQLSGYSMQSEIRLISYYINNGIVYNDELYDFGLIDYYALTTFNLEAFMNNAKKYKAKDKYDLKAIESLNNFYEKYKETNELSYEAAIEFVHELAITSGVGISKLDVDYIFEQLENNYIPINDYTFAEAINRYVENLEIVPLNAENDLSTIKPKIRL